MIDRRGAGVPRRRKLKLKLQAFGIAATLLDMLSMVVMTQHIASADRLDLNTSHGGHVPPHDAANLLLAQDQ